jgi:AcrR family transcriptional regulator
MSPRPRTVTDQTILGAAHRVINRLGPHGFTLADVSAEVGLAPATLVQRFGSKRGLLLAFAQSGVDYASECFTVLRSQHRSPLRAVIVAATQLAQVMTTPEEVARGLAFFEMDVTDDDFRRLTAESFRLQIQGYADLLDEAVVAGELVQCDTKDLARAILAISGGSLLNWAVLREGDAIKWVRRDVEALLRPYQRPAGQRG